MKIGKLFSFNVLGFGNQCSLINSLENPIKNENIDLNISCGLYSKIGFFDNYFCPST
jgi:hypothetical protein